MLSTAKGMAPALRILTAKLSTEQRTLDAQPHRVPPGEQHALERMHRGCIDLLARLWCAHLMPPEASAASAAPPCDPSLRQGFEERVLCLLDGPASAHGLAVCSVVTRMLQSMKGTESTGGFVCHVLPRLLQHTVWPRSTHATFVHRCMARVFDRARPDARPLYRCMACVYNRPRPDAAVLIPAALSRGSTSLRRSSTWRIMAYRTSRRRCSSS